MEFSETQSRAYSEWVRGVLLLALEEDVIAPEVTVAFTLSTFGRPVITYWGGCAPDTSCKIVLDKPI